MEKNKIPSFQSALTRHLEEANTDITSLARKAGVSRDALYKVVYGKTKSPSLETIILVAKAFGESVEEFMGLTPVQARDELLAEIELLSPQERSVLQASLAALRSQTHGDGAKKASDEEPDQ